MRESTLKNIVHSSLFNDLNVLWLIKFAVKCKYKTTIEAAQKNYFVNIKYVGKKSMLFPRLSN